MRAGQGMLSGIAGVSLRVPANGPAGDSHQPFHHLSELSGPIPFVPVFAASLLASGKVLWASSSLLSAGLPGAPLTAVLHRATGSSLPNSSNGWEVVVVVVFLPFLPSPGGVGSLVPAQGRDGTFAASIAGGEAHHEGPSTLMPGAVPARMSQKGGFTSVGAWTGLFFGEGEVPLWVIAPGTFSSLSHLNRVDFSGRWMSPSSKWLPWVPPSFCWSSGKFGAGCLLQQPPLLPAGVQEAVGDALLPGRLGTARAGRSPVPLSLPGVAVTVAELFQAMLQRDFWL